jgi:hypothetical protein
VVFFLGQELLEVSGHAAGPFGCPVMIWIQEWIGDHDQVWWQQLPVALGWLLRA